MFWGLIMEPNKRYTQTVEKPFHISQAAMDISTGDNDPCQVMVVVDQKNFLICTLQKGKAIQVPLDLYFKAGASVAFLTNGKCNVHLTGYLDPEFEDDESEGDEEAEEEEEEVPTLAPAKNKRKLDNSNDAVVTKKAKKQASKKAAAEEDSDSSDEDVDNNLQKFLNDDVDSDENDESFKANTSEEADSDEEGSDDDEEEDEEDDDEKDEEEDSKAETTLDSSLDTSKGEEKKLSKSQKRRLKKKEKQQQAQVNGVDKTKKAEKPEAQQKKGEKKQQEGKKQKELEVKAGEKREKKTLTGGVYIEDLKVGDGPVAKSGKTVLVYYEGRLKQNNKMFDNCNKGAGFKFRLGSKEVITGWDVGVAGMKVGGKRKIVCPPAMAYGAKGSPPVIPPNSTLVFEVELKNVK